MEPRFKKCSIEDCSNNAHRDSEGKLGYCSKHYQRVKRHGDHNVVKEVASPAKDWLINHAIHKSDDCLRWPFSVGKDGYGRVHDFDGGNLTTASRLMCKLAHGAAPSPLHEAAHSCGNGHNACVNPRHLYWATSGENKLDQIKHGTSKRGARHHFAKLSDDDVREIRRLLQIESHASIASKFGVSRGLISQISRGERWGWLD